MVLQSATIVFNDSASQFNKDLTDFLQRNIETAIIKGGLSFQFKIAKPADLAGLRQLGVKRLPAMLISSKSFVGVPDIIGEIRSRVKNSRSEATPKTEEEIVREYQMQSLGNITKDADGKLQVPPDADENDASADLMANYNKEVQRRGFALGGNQGENQQRDRPRPPSRQTDREHDDDEEYDAKPPPRKSYGSTGGRQNIQRRERGDNLANPGMADAFESLNNIGRNATGEDRQDDVMMGQLLARLGTD